MERKRNTKQKEKILEYLKNNENKHLSIQEIQEQIGNEIGQTTIYRMINFLSEEGKILKIPLENKQGFCYQYVEKNEKCLKHYHLICKKCGKLFHFETTKVCEIEKEAKNKFDFLIDDEKIVFYGICNECKNEV